MRLYSILALQENIELLSDITGLSLNCLKTEINVGFFKCYIICEDDLSKKGCHN